MSAPPLRRDRQRWRYRGAYRRWWSHRRGNGARHQHKDHQPASHERQSEHSQGKPDAVASASGRAGHSRRIPARRPTLAGIRPAVEARTGDGSRRVRSALCIRANPKATSADGSPHARLGQVQLERPEIEALAKSPCHTLASVPPAPRGKVRWHGRATRPVRAISALSVYSAGVYSGVFPECLFSNHCK